MHYPPIAFELTNEKNQKTRVVVDAFSERSLMAYSQVKSVSVRMVLPPKNISVWWRPSLYRDADVCQTGDFVFRLGNQTSALCRFRVGLVAKWRSDTIALGNSFGVRFIAGIKMPECEVVLRDSANPNSPTVTTPFSFQFMVLSDHDDPYRKSVGEYFHHLPRIQIRPRSKEVRFSDPKK